MVILFSESFFNVISGFSVSIGVYSLWLCKDGSVGNSSISLYFLNKLGSIEFKDISYKDISGSLSDGKKCGKKDVSVLLYFSLKVLEVKMFEMMGEMLKFIYKLI